MAKRSMNRTPVNPAPVNPAPNNPVNRSAAAVLGKLASLASPKPKAASKTVKWELPLTTEATADALRWIGAKAVLDPVEKRLEQARADFGEYALREISNKLCANKNKPSNPLVVIRKEDGKTIDHQFQFSLQDRFCKFKDLPDDNLREHFVNALIGVGLHPTDAAKLVDNELDFSPIPEVKSPKELLEGTYGEKREWIEATSAQKAAGAKLVAFLVWDGTGDVPEALTPEDQAIVIESRNSVTVRGGFHDRIAMYCQSGEQVYNVYQVIKPIFAIGFLKFAISDDEVTRSARKIESSSDILGNSFYQDGE